VSNKIWQPQNIKFLAQFHNVIVNISGIQQHIADSKTTLQVIPTHVYLIWWTLVQKWPKQDHSFNPPKINVFISSYLGC